MKKYVTCNCIMNWFMYVLKKVWMLKCAECHPFCYKAIFSTWSSPDDTCKQLWVHLSINVIYLFTYRRKCSEMSTIFLRSFESIQVSVYKIQNNFSFLTFCYVGIFFTQPPPLHICLSLIFTAYFCKPPICSLNLP